MRNSIDGALAEAFREESCGIPWFLLRPPMTPNTMRSIDEVRERLRNQRRETRHQVIAGLSFGFWSGLLLHAEYEDLWRKALHRAFPYSGGRRKTVGTQLEAIRKFRNRIAHHDSMLRLDIPFEMDRLFTVAGFIDPVAETWLRSFERATDVYRSRPHSPLDTVVVPAREAWQFYEQHRAYICQAGRWFQPVDRMAFYADREIKPDFPRVLERYDNVVWTETEAARLLASSDANDRKLGRVIKAGREAVWDGGTYQVFLLTRPGDERHRSVAAPIPHEAVGRGSAFVQRQRYVSLHDLETAATTNDLVAAPA